MHGLDLQQQTQVSYSYSFTLICATIYMILFCILFWIFLIGVDAFSLAYLVATSLHLSNTEIWKKEIEF